MTSTSHSRQKIKLKIMFQGSCFCIISWLVQLEGFGILFSDEDGSAAATDIKTTFSPSRNLRLNSRLCMSWQNHSIRKLSNGDGAHSKRKAPSEITLLIVHSSVIGIKHFWEQTKDYFQRYHYQTNDRRCTNTKKLFHYLCWWMLAFCPYLAHSLTEFRLVWNWGIPID